MLTLTTPLKIFRFRQDRIIEKISNFEHQDTPIVEVSYATAIEVEAALRGEEYSLAVIDHDFDVLDDDSDDNDDDFTFECSDGSLTMNYDKTTLARHSLLIRGFIEDYPDADRIVLEGYSKSDVERVIDVIIEGRNGVLDESVLATLRLLTPPTDLYYFFFELPGSLDPSFIISIIRGMTQNERDDVLRVHRYDCQSDTFGVEVTECTHQRELPDGGRDLGIAYAFDEVKKYLRKRYVPELHDPYPSYRFYEMILQSNDSNTKKDLLFSASFDDDCGLLSNLTCERFLIEHILSLASDSWNDLCIALGMLGSRSIALGNYEMERLAPYQLRLSHGSIKRGVWLRIRSSLVSRCGLNREVDFAIEPYLVNY